MKRRKANIDCLHPELKERWHTELQRLLKSREIVKPVSCPKCGRSDKSIHPHCPDASISPKINVDWCCSVCHGKIHKCFLFDFLDWTEEERKERDKKVSKIMTGYKHTEEHNKNMSRALTKAMTGKKFSEEHKLHLTKKWRMEHR